MDQRHETLHQEFNFRLSLLKLMTEPHAQDTTTEAPARRLEELAVLAPRS